jgi:predicted enzyme related to lactoylglutathione lyase
VGEAAGPRIGSGRPGPRQNAVVTEHGAAGDPVFRPGGISYLRIPAPDPGASAAFYRAVFGWQVDDDRREPRFADATGHVIGHLVADRPGAGDAGVIPYVYVESLDQTLRKVPGAGGRISTPAYPEGDLRVATVVDPAGNVIGVWQHVG